MELPTLYKRAVTGAVQKWTIEIVDDKYRTHSGQVDGTITTTEWTVAKAKNTNKANATTAVEQALRDATSKWQKKIDREQFVEDVSKVDDLKFIQPMLAQNFDDRRDEINFRSGVWVQCKLNGARCIATKDGLFSRKGSVWKSVPHINRALEEFFKLHPEVVLDGELFNCDLRQDLGKIISLISKDKITEADLIQAENTIQYHVYDVVDATSAYMQRMQLVQKYVTEINSPMVKAVASQLVTSLEEIDQLLQSYEQEGHEGAIVRTNGVYENKRSKNLLKYKTFTDDEFKIVDIIEGEGNLTGKVGKFVLVDSRGVEFRSAPTGSHEYWEQMWKDRGKLVGLLATVKYKELTPVKNGKGGVPSFGKVVSIRNYE